MQYIVRDDVSGDLSNPNMAIAARNEELDYFKSMHAYDYAPLSKCVARTIPPQIGTRCSLG